MKHRTYEKAIKTNIKLKNYKLEQLEYGLFDYDCWEYKDINFYAKSKQEANNFIDEYNGELGQTITIYLNGKYYEETGAK